MNDNENGINEGRDPPFDLRTLSSKAVLQMIGTDEKLGLSTEEIKIRLNRYGPNQIPEVQANLLFLFLKKFWGVTPWMLEFTIVIALLRSRVLDAVIVSALLLFNGILGFFQEQRASKAVETLKSRLQIWVRTLRDGTWNRITASALVPGDIIRLRSGDFVPADLKILSGTLEADLSALTGESGLKSVKPEALLNSGAVVKQGEATAVVLQTGSKTAFGKTSQLVQLARPKLHFEEIISQVVRWLLLMVGTLLAVATLVWALKDGEILEILPLLLILLVSAIPVALPAMFTLTLALGSNELVRQGVLVTRLSASEDAARMDVLCCDKTGTLTENRLTLSQMAPAKGFTEEDILCSAFYCSEEANQDPIDLAFLREARERGLPKESFRTTSFTPFDPATRRTEALVSDGIREWRTVKGSLDAVFSLCMGPEDEKKRLKTWANGFALKGYRSIAVAREEKGVMRLAGLALLFDPPRPDSKGMIQELEKLGVKVKMLTGDALPIARETARALGLGDNILELKREDTQSTDKIHSDPLEQANGFAGIFPEDKFKIVRTLQEKGHVVGMTGDGVNDAPALRQAEVGVAMENATDVAKGAASMVLTREGLSALPGLIQVGRSIHQRIETWILNKITKTFQTVVFIVVTFLATGKFIVSTFDMVLLLFLVDFVTLSLATDRNRGSARPASWNTTDLVRTGLLLGIFLVIESLGLLAWQWNRFKSVMDSGTLHTFGFETLFYFSLFTVLVIREKGPFWSSKPSIPLLAAILCDMVLVAFLATTGAPGLVAIPWRLTLTVIGYSFCFGLVVNDFLKLRVSKIQPGQLT